MVGRGRGGGGVNAASAGGASSWGVCKILKSRGSDMLFSAFSTRYFVQNNQCRSSVK